MRRSTGMTLLVALASLPAFTTTAHAALPDGPGPWADTVIDAVQGTRADGAAVPAARSNPEAALGAAEGDTAESSFYSLGFGGRVILGFENKICNGPGEQDLDLELVEATIETGGENSSYPSELVDVYVSADNVSYTLVATDVNKDELLALPPSIAIAQHYVKLVDVTRLSDFIGPAAPRQRPDADGYDVDGVRAMNTSGCPELVGTGRMTGGGSLFLSNGTRVTHGFTLRCNRQEMAGNNLEVNWGKGNKFHAESIDFLTCLDYEDRDEGKPVAGFDTVIGKVTGRYNGTSGYTAEFEFSDEGEPGTSDLGRIVIKTPDGTTTILDVADRVTKGNQQAHSTG